MKKHKVNQNNSDKPQDIAVKRKKRNKIILTLCACMILIPLISIAIAVGGFAIWTNTQSIDKSLLPTATAVPVFYDSEGNPLPYSESNYVDIASVNDNLKNAFVALEDKRFYEHKGYDTVRMAGAMLKNIKSGGVREGASTITQQLIKNTHLTQERTLKRKLKELALAIQLEKEYNKDEILAMYLSVIYFGNGAYGVKQASNTYFGKNIEDLTLAQCATLAGIVRNPAKYAPNKNPEQSTQRRNVTLSVMREQNYISESEYESAVAEPMTVVNTKEDGFNSVNAKACEFYISQAQKEVCEALGITKYQLSNSGLKIYTNLDVKLQEELERQRLSSENFSDSATKSVSVVIDNATGAVLAYSSSYPYSISRQAGSVLKPLAVYAPAIDKKLISLATPIIDEKIDFGGYSPSNYGGVYYGDTTVREAIKKSMNSVSVKVMDYLGADNSANYLHKFGIDVSENDKTYALALGATANGVSPLAVAGGYSALARNGLYIKPSFVKYVVDNGTKILANNADYAEGTQNSARVISESASALITSALVDTVKDGTAKSLGILPFEVASKTGTVQRSDNLNSDAWNASYNEQYTVVVWHGSDDGINEKGGGYPTRHATKIWRAVAENKPIISTFHYNQNIVQMEVDTYSTKINRQVISATQNTPIEYRKTEYFALDNLPTSAGSKFDSTPYAKMNIQNNNGRIFIDFESEKIYRYELYRSDVTGTSLILSTIGTGECVAVDDRPITFDGKVEYTLICYLNSNEELSNSYSQSVYIKDTNIF